MSTTALPLPRIRPRTRPSGQGGAAALGGAAESAPRGWQDEVRQLAADRRAVVLAHNYQAPEIQDVAHHVGDSLALSRIAAATDASVIVFAGVHFMAETAKLLAPDRLVLIPDAAAGCSLADTITADQLRSWKDEHPGAAVVAYVNTTAAVKAESDICCTSSNAVEVVRSIPADREILFLPDRFLGAHVQRITGRPLHLWAGQCHVHAQISAADVRAQAAAHPDADVLVHPECGCTSAVLEMAVDGTLPAERTHILSTGGMARHATESTAAEALVATEVGMLHQLQRANPATRFLPVTGLACCHYMKMTTPPKLLRSLRDLVEPVEVAEDVAVRARAAVQAMVAIGGSR